jgi:hypothetical protein
LVTVADSESVPSETDATRSVGFGFASRATTTSCARICPAMAKLQSNAVKSSFSIKAAVINKFGAIDKRLIAKRPGSLNS